MRTCKMCNTDISHRHHTSKYCENCAQQRKRDCVKRIYYRERVNVPRCKKCLKPTNRHGRAKYCLACLAIQNPKQAKKPVTKRAYFKDVLAKVKRK